MSTQYIQDKDISVCTLGAHQALIKVTSQNKVKRSNGKLLATENDRMGDCYGCYKSPAYISILSTILMASFPLQRLCLLGSIAGALAGAVVGFLRGAREGQKIGENVGGTVGRVLGWIEGGIMGNRLGLMGGAAVGFVGTYSFLHGKVSEMLESVFIPNICASYTKLSVWSKVHPHVKIRGQRALLEGATLTCVQGGLITIIKPDFSEAADMLCLSYFAYNRTSIEKPDDYDMEEVMEGLNEYQKGLLKGEKLRGYQKLSNEELSQVGITNPKELNDPDTGFKADLYKDDKGNYILAYRGTYSAPAYPENDLVHDWSKEWTDDNLRQGLGMGSKQYEKSIDLAKKINRNKPKGKKLTITGHSLGGGLATAAGAATDRHMLSARREYIPTPTICIM